VAFIRHTKNYTSAQFTSHIITSQLTSEFTIPSEPHPTVCTQVPRYHGTLSDCRTVVRYHVPKQNTYGVCKKSDRAIRTTLHVSCSRKFGGQTVKVSASLSNLLQILLRVVRGDLSKRIQSEYLNVFRHYLRSDNSFQGASRTVVRYHST
jgi:hypothetical protein